MNPKRNHFTVFSIVLVLVFSFLAVVAFAADSYFYTCVATYGTESKIFCIDTLDDSGINKDTTLTQCTNILLAKYKWILNPAAKEIKPGLKNQQPVCVPANEEYYLFEGTVVTEIGGKQYPVPDVTVQFKAGSLSYGNPVRTNDAGYFSKTIHSSVNNILFSPPPGFVGDNPSIQKSDSGKAFVLRVKGETDAPPTYVSGKVTDSAGSPVINALVSVAGKSSFVSTSTDASGNYVLILPDYEGIDAPYVLAFKMISGIAYTGKSNSTVSDKGAHDIRLSAPQTRTIYGQVKEEGGGPLSGAFVTLAIPKTNIILSATTNATGGYSIQNFPMVDGYDATLFTIWVYATKEGYQYYSQILLEMPPGGFFSPIPEGPFLRNIDMKRGTTFKTECRAGGGVFSGKVTPWSACQKACYQNFICDGDAGGMCIFFNPLPDNSQQPGLCENPSVCRYNPESNPQPFCAYQADPLCNPPLDANGREKCFTDTNNVCTKASLNGPYFLKHYNLLVPSQYEEYCSPAGRCPQDPECNACAGMSKLCEYHSSPTSVDVCDVSVPASYHLSYDTQKKTLYSGSENKTALYCNICLFEDRNHGSPFPLCSNTCKGAGYTCCPASDSQESAPPWVENTCYGGEVCSASCSQGSACTDSNKWLCTLYGGTLTPNLQPPFGWLCDIPVCTDAALPACPVQIWSTDEQYWGHSQFYSALLQYSYTAGGKTYEVKNPYVNELSCACGQDKSPLLGTNILNAAISQQSGNGLGASCCIEGLQIQVDNIRDYVPEEYLRCFDYDMDGISATQQDIDLCNRFLAKYVLYPNDFDTNCTVLFSFSSALQTRCTQKLGKDAVRHFGQLISAGDENEIYGCGYPINMVGVHCSIGDYGEIMGAQPYWTKKGNVIQDVYGTNLNDGLLNPAFTHRPTACLERGTLSGMVVSADGTPVASGFVAYGEPAVKRKKEESKKTVTYNLADNYEDNIGTFLFENAPIDDNYQYKLSAFNLVGDRGTSKIIPSQYTVENNAISNIIIQLGTESSRTIRVGGIVYYLPEGEAVEGGVSGITGHFTLIELLVIINIIGQLMNQFPYQVLAHGGKLLPGVTLTLVNYYNDDGEECTAVSLPPLGLFAFSNDCKVPEGEVMMISAHDPQERAKDYFGFFVADRNVNATEPLHIEKIRMEFYEHYTVTGNVYDLLDGQLDNHGYLLKKPSKNEILKDKDGNPLPFTVYYKARGKVYQYNFPGGGTDGKGRFVLDDDSAAVIGQGSPLECQGNGQCYIWADAFGYKASKQREITLTQDIVLTDPLYLKQSACGLDPESPLLESVDNVLGQKAIEIKWTNECPVRYFYVYRCDMLSGTGSTCSDIADFEPVSDPIVPTAPDQESFSFRDRNFMSSYLELQEPVGDSKPNPIAHENRYKYFVQAVYKYPFVRSLNSDQKEVTGGYEECMRGTIAFCGATPYWKHFEFRCGIGESARTPKNIIYSFGDNIPGQLTQDIPGDQYPGRNCGSLICIKQPGSKPDRVVYGKNGEPVYPTTCIPQEPCEACNVPYGAFAPSLREPYAGQTCADTMSCVLDYSESNFDKYERCENVLSCYDYRSQAACKQNKCLPEDCMWDTTIYDFLSIGVCRPQNRNIQDCSQCTSFISSDYSDARSKEYAEAYKEFETSMNAVFSSCSSHLCSRYGDHRPLTQYDVCGYNDFYGCRDQNDMACEDYGTDKQACVGPSTAERSSVFDNYRNYHAQSSNDYYGIGVCRYLYSPYGCAKDTDVVGSDYNGIGSGFLGTPDCMFYTGQEKRDCELDRQPPYAYTDSLGAYGDNLNIMFFSHDAETSVTGTYVEVCDAQNVNADPLQRCRSPYYYGYVMPTDVLTLDNLYAHSQEGYTGDSLPSERDYVIDYYARDRYSNLMLSKRVEFRFDNHLPAIKDQDENLEGLNLLMSVSPVCEQELQCEQECGGTCTPECPKQGIYQQAMAACYGLDSQGNFNQNLLVGEWKANAMAKIDISNWESEEVVACKAALMKDGKLVGTFGADTLELEEYITNDEAKRNKGMFWELSFAGLEDGQEYCLYYYCLDNVMNINGNPEFAETVNTAFLKKNVYFDHDYEDAAKLQSKLPTEKWYGTDCRKIYADPSVIIYKPNPQYGNRDKFYENKVDFEVLTLSDDVSCKFNVVDLDGNGLVSQQEFESTGVDFVKGTFRTFNGKQYTSHTYDDFIIYSPSENEKFIFPVRCMVPDTKKIIGHGLNLEFVYDRKPPETEIMTAAEVTIPDMAGTAGWITESMANELKFFCKDPQVTLPAGARRTQPLEFGCYGTVYCKGFECTPPLTDMKEGTPLNLPRPTGPMNYCYFSADRSYLLGGPNIEETKCEFIPVDKWAPVVGDARFTTDMQGQYKIQPGITDNHTVYFKGILKNPVVAEFDTKDLSLIYPYTFTRYRIEADVTPTIPETLYGRVPLLYVAATKDLYYALVYTQVSPTSGRLEVMKGNYIAEETKVAEQFFKLYPGATYHVSVDAQENMKIDLYDVTAPSSKVTFTFARDASTMKGAGIYLLDTNTHLNKSQRQGYADIGQYSVAFSDVQIYNIDALLQLPGRSTNKMQSDVLSYKVEMQKPSSMEDPYPARQLAEVNGIKVKLVAGSDKGASKQSGGRCANDVRVCPDGTLVERQLPGCDFPSSPFCQIADNDVVYSSPPDYADYRPVPQDILENIQITVPLTFESDRLGYHKVLVTLEDEVNTKEYQYQIYHDVVGPDHYATTVKDRGAEEGGQAPGGTIPGTDEITLGSDFVVETTAEDTKGTALFKSYDTDYRVALPYNYDTVYLQINNEGNLWPNPYFSETPLTAGQPRYTIDTTKGVDDSTSLLLSTGGNDAVFVLDVSPAAGPEDYVFSGYLDISGFSSDPVHLSATFEFFNAKGQKLSWYTQTYQVDYANLGSAAGFRPFTLTIDKPYTEVSTVKVTFRALPSNPSDTSIMSVYLDNVLFTQPSLNNKPAVVPDKFNLARMDKTAEARPPYPSDRDYTKTLESRRNLAYPGLLIYDYPPGRYLFTMVMFDRYGQLTTKSLFVNVKDTIPPELKVNINLPQGYPAELQQPQSRLKVLLDKIFIPIQHNPLQYSINATTNEPLLQKEFDLTFTYTDQFGRSRNYPVHMVEISLDDGIYSEFISGTYLYNSTGGVIGIAPANFTLNANEFRGIKPEVPALFSATATDWAGNAIDKNIANDHGFYIWTFVGDLPVIYYPPTAPEPDSRPDNKMIYLNSLNFTLGGINQPPSAGALVKVSILDTQTAVPQSINEITTSTDATSSQPPYVGEGFLYDNTFRGDNAVVVEYSSMLQPGQLLSFTEQDGSIIPAMERYFLITSVQPLPAGPGRQRVEFSPRLTKALRGNRDGAMDYQIFKVYAGSQDVDGPLGWFEPNLEMPFSVADFNRSSPDYYAYPYIIDKYGRASDFDIRLGHYSYMRHLYFDLDKPYLGEIYPAPNSAKGLEIPKVEFHILDAASGIYLEDIALIVEKDKGKPSALTKTLTCDGKLLVCAGTANNRLVTLKDPAFYKNGVLDIGLYNFTVHALDKAGNLLSTDSTNITSWLLEIINGPHTPTFNVLDSNYYATLTEDSSNRPLGYDQLGIWYADYDSITATVNYDHPDDIGRSLRILDVSLISLDGGSYGPEDILCNGVACKDFTFTGGEEFIVTFTRPLNTEGIWLFTLLAVKLDLNGQPVYPETEGLIVGNTFSIVIDMQDPEIFVEVPAEYPHGDLRQLYGLDGTYDEQSISVLETQEYGTYPETLYSVRVEGAKKDQLLGNPLQGYYSQLFEDGVFSTPIRLYAYLINDRPWYREVNLTFTDRAGNIQKFPTKVLYDHKSPSVSVTSILDLNKLSVQVMKINPSSTGPGGTVQVKLNGDVVTLTVGLDYTVGTLTVRVIDMAPDGSSADFLFIEAGGSTLTRTMVPDERQLIQLENSYGTKEFNVTGGWENTPGTLSVDIVASDLFAFPTDTAYCEGGISECTIDNLPLNSGLKEIRICKQENATPTRPGACPTQDGQTLWLIREPYGWSSPANIDGTFEDTFTRPHGLDQETYEVYRIEAEDWASRITSATYTIKYDITPPITTYNYSHNGRWYNKNALIVLKANDSFSGVAATYYCTYMEDEDTCTTYTLYREPVYVLDEGITYFRFYSVDNAGNEEVAQEIKVMLDKTLPILDEPVSVLSANDLFVWKDPLTKVWSTGDTAVHIQGKYRELHPKQVFRKQANQQGYDVFELLEDNYFLLKNIQLNEGMNQIVVAMTDEANNTGLLPELKVVSDRKGPNITMVNAQYLNTETPVLRIQADEYASCSFIPNPGSQEESYEMVPDTDHDYGPEVDGRLTSRYWLYEIGGDVPPLSSGQVYDVKFSCADMFGNTAEKFFYIVIDTTPPELRVLPVWTDNLVEDPYFDASLDYAYQLTGVAKETKKLQAKFDVEDWNFFDYSQDITCAYTLDSPFKVIEKEQVLGTKAFGEKQTFTTMPFLHGYMDEYRYTITCTDRAGNVGQVFLYMIINTKKDFKIVHTSPAAGDYLTQNTNIPLEVTTNFAVDDTKGCQYRQGTIGENWADMTKAASNRYTAAIASLSEGQFYTYTVRCFPYNIDMQKDDVFVTFGIDTVPSDLLLSADITKAADHVLAFSWRVNAQTADAPIDHYVYWLNTSTDIIGQVYEEKLATKTYTALPDGTYTFNVYGITVTGLSTPVKTYTYTLTTNLLGWNIIDAIDNLQVMTFAGEQIQPVDGIYYTKHDKLRVTGKTQTTNVTFMYQRYTPNKVRLPDSQQREFDLYPIELFEEGMNHVELVGADVNLKIILHAELNISLDSTSPKLILTAPVDGFTDTAFPTITFHSSEELNACYLTYLNDDGLKKQLEMTISPDRLDASVAIPESDPLDHNENTIKRIQVQVICLDDFLNHNAESNQNFVITIDQSDVVVGVSESVNGLLRKASFIENALATYDIIRGRDATTYTHMIAHASKPVQCQYAGGTSPPDVGMQYGDAGNTDFAALYHQGYFLKPRSDDLLLDDATLYHYGTVCKDHAGNVVEYPFLTTLDINLTRQIKVFDILPQPFSSSNKPISTAYTDVAASCTISQYQENTGFIGFLKGLLEGLRNFFRKQATMHGERLQLYKHSALISESATQSQRVLQDYGTYWFKISCVKLYSDSDLTPSDDYLFIFIVDTVPPGVIIQSPDSYEEFSQSETELKVTVSEVYPEKLAVYINSQLFEERLFKDFTDGDFYLGDLNTSNITHTYNLRLPVYLKSGENNVTVLVTDQAGNTNGEGETAYYIFNNVGPSISYLFPNRPAILPSLDAVQVYAMPNLDAGADVSAAYTTISLIRIEEDNAETTIPILYDVYLTEGVERFESLLIFENITNSTNESITEGRYKIIAEVRDVNDVLGEKALAFITIKEGVSSFIQTIPAKVKATVRSEGYTVRGTPSFTTPWLAQHVVLNNQLKPANIKRVASGQDVTYTLKLVSGQNSYYYRLVDLNGVTGQTGTYSVVRDDNAPAATICIGAYDYESLASCLAEHHITVDELASWLGLPQGMSLQEFVKLWLG